MKKLILFDFDGVLSDSFNSLYEINRLGTEHIGKTITPEEYKACFFGPLHKELKKKLELSEAEAQAYLEYKVSIFPQHYNPDLTRLFPFAEKLVTALSAVGKLYIVSSAPEPVIRRMLKNKDLEQYFEEISGINKEGKHKTFEHILSREQAQAEQVYFITDTVGDVREGKEVSFQVVAVDWGFHTKEVLVEEHPSLVASTSQEIIDFISK